MDRVVVPVVVPVVVLGVLVVVAVASWARLVRSLACSTALLPPDLPRIVQQHTDFMKSGSGQLGNLLTFLSTFVVVAQDLTTR